MSRPRSPRFRRALLLSGVAHAGLIGALWAISASTERMPEMRVYAVNIVSPPPQEAGPPSPEVVPEPEPEPEEEPEVEEEPEEEPTPAPPPPPPPPAPRPTPPPPPAPRPQPERPSQPEPEPDEPEPEPDEPEPSRSTGDRPDPDSPGGDDLDVQLRGVQCPTPEYCNNIIRQVNRHFRSPGGSAAGEADVYFIINRDGSITGLRLLSSTGGSGFRLAVLEAVEQAGRNRAFGPLPRQYQADQLPVSFFFRPAR